MKCIDLMFKMAAAAKRVCLSFMLLICAFGVLSAQTIGETFRIQPLTAGEQTSIRGISVVSDSMIWVSGSQGTVGRSLDGGHTWQWQVVKGFERADFRCLKAWNDKKAIIINAGEPAHVLLTTNGGQSWKEVYGNSAKGIFFDGLLFWNRKQGIAVSDPLNGKLFLIRTRNGGRSWKAILARSLPAVVSGEAFFAASNSILVKEGRRKVWIGSGGTASHVFFSPNRGRRWKVYNCPVLQGKASTGIFSLAFWSSKNGIIVGGDYQADSVRVNNAFLTRDGGKTWQRPVVNPFGYRSCVAYYTDRMLVATGPSGTDISSDAGATWKKLSKEGFNVVQKAGNGMNIYLAGEDGKIARLIFLRGEEKPGGF